MTKQKLCGGWKWIYMLGAIAFIAEAFNISVTRDGRSTENKAPAAVESTGNPAQDRLLQLPSDARATGLGQIAGEGCVGERSFYMGLDPDSHDAWWSVQCKSGKSYVIRIHPDATGSTEVEDCEIYQFSTKSECFERIRGTI